MIYRNRRWFTPESEALNRDFGCTHSAVILDDPRALNPSGIRATSPSSLASKATQSQAVPAAEKPCFEL